MPARIVKGGRGLSNIVTPFMQLQTDEGLSPETLVQMVADIFGSQHVILYDAQGNPISGANPIPTGSSLLAVTALFNSALPAAEADWLGTFVGPAKSPSYVRLYICVAVAGIFRVVRDIGGTSVVEDLNSGVALNANAAYMFDVEWREGDGLNFRYSATGGNILTFRANEIGGTA